VKEIVIELGWWCLFFAEIMFLASIVLSLARILVGKNKPPGNKSASPWKKFLD